MNVDNRSSSNDLSSAPSSDIESPYPNHHSHSNTIIVSHGVQHASSTTGVPSSKLDGHSGQAPATRQDGASAKPKKPSSRKKKEVDPATAVQEKPKKPRKPRDPTSTTAPRKKQKTTNTIPTSVSTEHTTQTTSLNASTLVQPASFAENRAPFLHEAAKISQNGFSNHSSAMNSGPPSPAIPRYQATPPVQPAVPRSRNIFDPVRGIERASDHSQTTTYHSSLNETPPRQPFRPSASPAISSILNPTDVQDIPSIPFHPSTNNASTRVIDLEESRPTSASAPTVSNLDGTTSNEANLKKSAVPEKAPTEVDAKPKRAKEQLPPVASGSGLLNSTFFGGESAIDKSEPSSKGTNIMLHIDLKDPKNKIFNFARMAEEKYGFAAVYPRQAAQKKRLAEVAAHGAALEKAASVGKREGTSAGESGDEDLSVDIDRDSDNDGDIAMGGVNGTNDNSGTDGPVPKQRKKRRDEYDADDPFVDDSEMLWEAQAAASKDGFFVYCGPLVPDGEKPSVERTEGTSKRGRGRGRGGAGAGTRGGRATATGSTPADGSTRANGTNPRGGGITRKPRITKAERAQRDLEKKQREQMALAAKPAVAPV